MEPIGLWRTRFTVLRATPPYSRPLRVDAHRIRDDLVPGTIWPARIEAISREWPQLAVWAPRVRRLFPDVPIVVIVADRHDFEVLNYGRLMASVGIRAAMSERAPLGPTLRDCMTPPGFLALDVIEWFHTCIAPIDSTVRDSVAEIVRASEQHRSLTRFLSARALKRRPLAKRLERRGLPSPGEWFTLGRALHTALRLQAAPDVPVLTHALEMGYEDASVIRQRLRNLFDTNPSTIKATLGWEWLAHRWWTSRRAGR